MTPIHMDRFESGVRTIIAFTEALNRHEIWALLELYSQDCILEAPARMPSGITYRGKTELLHYWQEFFTRMPEARLKTEEIFGFGIRCVLRWRCDWKDEAGSFVLLRGLDLFRVQNGLITEQLSYTKGRVFKDDELV